MLPIDPRIGRRGRDREMPIRQRLGERRQDPGPMLNRLGMSRHPLRRRVERIADRCDEDEVAQAHVAHDASGRPDVARIMGPDQDDAAIGEGLGGDGHHSDRRRA